MKVSILTFHFACNCGAVLQCLALQEILQKMKCEIEIINYRPRYHTNRYAIFSNPFVYAGSQAKNYRLTQGFFYTLFLYPINFLRAVHSWIDYKKKKIGHQDFANFEKKYLKLSNSSALTSKKLKRLTLDSDLYICGSDQLWNASLTENQLDYTYMFDFLNNAQKRISYAVGVDFNNCKIDRKKVSELLSAFDYISIREKKNINDINGLIKTKNIRTDIDPTLLLETTDYDKYCSRTLLEKEKYILVYCIPDESQQTICKLSQIVAKKFCCKTINFTGFTNCLENKYSDTRIGGPDKFLWYIKNAAYIITNSFHGTIFSVIYEKNFRVVPHSQTGYRITELLEQLELSTPCIYNAGSQNSLSSVPDYNKAKRIIKKYQADSIAYLKKHISEEKNG